MNKTLLCLIHKFCNAIILRNYKLLGLYNTNYKLVKIISNCIKPFLLPNIIGPSQAYFPLSKGGLGKGFRSIGMILHQSHTLFFQLFSKLSTLIMSCVYTSSISTLTNGWKINSFKLAKGIGQGDPISPYLSSFS